MYTYLLVAAGGALSSTLRFWLGGLIASRIGETFPWGTLIINVTGSFVIGLFATVTGPDGRVLVPGVWRQFFMIGVCGGYTTFSSFSLQTLNLAQGGEWPAAGLNILASVALCLLGAWLGHISGLMLNE